MNIEACKLPSPEETAEMQRNMEIEVKCRDAYNKGFSEARNRMTTLIGQAILDEREECAKIAHEYIQKRLCVAGDEAREIVRRIRERGILVTTDLIHQAITDAEVVEREECAKIAEDMIADGMPDTFMKGGVEYAKRITAKIRERGSK